MQWTTRFPHHQNCYHDQEKEAGKAGKKAQTRPVQPGAGHQAGPAISVHAFMQTGTGASRKNAARLYDPRRPGQLGQIAQRSQKNDRAGVLYGMRLRSGLLHPGRPAANLLGHGCHRRVMAQGCKNGNDRPASQMAKQVL